MSEGPYTVPEALGIVLRRLDTIEKRIDDVYANLRDRLQSIDSRLIVIEGDLRTFYRDLGRHDSRLDNLEGRQ
jgi:tetrahydromethanopterin S-methyltransferase subunit G